MGAGGSNENSYIKGSNSKSGSSHSNDKGNHSNVGTSNTDKKNGKASAQDVEIQNFKMCIQKVTGQKMYTKYNPDDKKKRKQ